jgi:hypothetical protein
MLGAIIGKRSALPGYETVRRRVSTFFMNSEEGAAVTDEVWLELCLARISSATKMAPLDLCLGLKRELEPAQELL